MIRQHRSKGLFASMTKRAQLKYLVLFLFSLFSLFFLPAYTALSGTGICLFFFPLMEVGASLLSNMIWLLVRTAYLSHETPTPNGLSRTNYFLLQAWWFCNNFFLADGLISLLLSMKSGFPALQSVMHILPSGTMYGLAGTVFGVSTALLIIHLVCRIIRSKESAQTQFSQFVDAARALPGTVPNNNNPIEMTFPAKGKDCFMLSPNPIQFRTHTLDPFRFCFEEDDFPFRNENRPSPHS